MKHIGKSVELMRKAIREHDKDLIEKLKNEENWTEQEICHEMGHELVARCQKRGMVYEIDELEKMVEEKIKESLKEKSGDDENYDEE